MKRRENYHVKLTMDMIDTLLGILADERERLYEDWSILREHEDDELDYVSIGEHIGSQIFYIDMIQARLMLAE